LKDESKKETWTQRKTQSLGDEDFFVTKKETELFVFIEFLKIIYIEIE